jgi:flotillin
MASGAVLVWPVLAFVVMMVLMLIFLASRYKRCPSDKILVIYGSGPGMKGRTAKMLHGGGALIWPLVQNYAFLDLKPMTININLTNALSLQNIRINVPSTFTIGISIDKSIMLSAAERLLHQNPAQIEEMAKEIIFGQLRLTVATLTIEQINQDRELFLEAIRTNVDHELNKVGLFLINVNVTDIHDESEYIESIGKKAAATAVNAAKVDVAAALRDGEIGKAAADREREIKVAENEAQSEKGKKSAERDERVFVQQQESIAVEGENISRASIADYNATLAEKEAEASRRSEVAQKIAEMEIQKAQYLMEQERLKAEDIVREEIQKTQIEIAAEAEAQRLRRIAKGQADATLARYEAEAEGQQKVLEGKAIGYAKLVASAGGDAKAAATLLMVEKIETMVEAQVEAIKNLKIDNITVWDSGGGDGDGSSTSNFISSLVKSLPPLHDVAANAGVDLPEYLGTLSDNTDE